MTKDQLSMTNENVEDLGPRWDLVIGVSPAGVGLAGEAP
jgi:hypothetical protein